MKIKFGLILGLAVLLLIGTTWWLSLEALPADALPGLTATLPVEPSPIPLESAPTATSQPGVTHPTGSDVIACGEVLLPSPPSPTGARSAGRGQGEGSSPTSTLCVTEKKDPHPTLSPGAREEKSPQPSPSPRVKSATPTLTLQPSPIPSFTSLPTIVLPQNLLQSTGILQEDFENPKQWLKIVGSTTPDAAPEYKTGKGALRLKGDDNRIVVERQGKWDLSTSDCIRLWVDQPKRGNGVFEIVLSTQANFSRYFSKEVKPNPIGWTLVQICRDDFNNIRGDTWKAPIIRIRIQVNPGDEFYFDGLHTHVSPVPIIMINFDDANASDYTIAYPILKRLHIPATSYVPTANIGAPGDMTVAQLLELQANGWTIGNHTVHHVLLRDLSEADQQNEIATALKTLKGWGITGGRYLSYPIGKYNATTLAIMSRLGILSGRTVSNAPDVFPQINPFILRDTQDISGFSLEEVKSMVDKTLTNRGILTLLFHQLVEGDSLEGTEWNRAKFDELMTYIAKKKVATLTIDQFIQLANGEVTIERAR